MRQSTQLLAARTGLPRPPAKPRGVGGGHFHHRNPKRLLAQHLQLIPHGAVCPFHEPGVFRRGAALAGEVAGKILHHDEVHWLTTGDFLILPVNVPLRPLFRRDLMLLQPHSQSLRKDQMRGLVHPLVLHAVDLVEQLLARFSRLATDICPTKFGWLSCRPIQRAIVAEKHPAEILQLLQPRHGKPALATDLRVIVDEIQQYEIAIVALSSPRLPRPTLPAHGDREIGDAHKHLL